MTATKTDEPIAPAPAGNEQWMPNGFPPPSFVVETERTRTFFGARGRWLAAAAILGALLLIAGIVLIARDGDNTEVATGSTTTSFGGTNPTFPSSTALDPTATLPDATTVPGAPVDPNAPPAPAGGGGGGTPAPAPPPPGPGQPPPAAPGVIAADPGSVTLGPLDAADPARAKAGAKLTLRNTGGSPLSFSAESTFRAGLTASPSTGNIAPGGAQVVDIVLDATNAPERNPFTAQIRFAGSGGNTTVTVSAVVRRPPVIVDAGDATCPINDGCSKQILRVVQKSACQPDWRIRVAVTDDTGVSTVTAKVNEPGGARDVTLVKEADGRTWTSPPQPAAPKGVTTFTVTAVDTLGAVATGAQQTISCA